MPSTKSGTKGHRRRVGRKRRVNVDRKPSGDVILSQRDVDPAISPELLDQRGRLVGPAHALDQRAGYPLGVLCLCGVINQQQHDVGMRLSSAWQMWGTLSTGQPAQPRGGRDCDRAAIVPDDVELLRRRLSLERQLRDVESAVRVVAAGALAWSLLDTLCHDWLMPPALDRQSPLYRDDWPIGRAALRAGLDAVAAAM